jgi:hypothetical protein
VCVCVCVCLSLFWFNNLCIFECLLLLFVFVCVRCTYSPLLSPLCGVLCVLYIDIVIHCLHCTLPLSRLHFAPNILIHIPSYLTCPSPYLSCSIPDSLSLLPLTPFSSSFPSPHACSNPSLPPILRFLPCLPPSTQCPSPLSPSLFRPIHRYRQWSTAVYLGLEGRRAL